VSVSNKMGLDTYRLLLVQGCATTPRNRPQPPGRRGPQASPTDTLLRLIGGTDLVSFSERKPVSENRTGEDVLVFQPESLPTISRPPRSNSC